MTTVSPTLTPTLNGGADTTYTVGNYLATRFEQIGVKHHFVVPGDYNLVLLDQLLRNKNLQQIGCCNELNAAYAAEGYARVKGVGAVITTFNVGAFSAPSPYTPGNTATLSNVRGCANFDEDLSLQKLVTIHERLRFLVSADAQNVFNRHQWIGLNTNIDTPGFGQFTGATSPRLLQLHARLEF